MERRAVLRPPRDLEPPIRADAGGDHPRRPAADTPGADPGPARPLRQGPDSHPAARLREKGPSTPGLSAIGEHYRCRDPGPLPRPAAAPPGAHGGDTKPS